MRRLAGTRKVGHAGTLDPMATGVLVVGIGRATRLLTHIVGANKTYEATIRLGIGTDSDDADGAQSAVAAPGAIETITRAQIDSGISDLTGDISQVPNQVSAIKVDGQRAYALARAGEVVELKARPVTIGRFDVLDSRAGTAEGHPVIDLDVVVDCSTGTYIRALARDLGAGLGVPGHLTALRRTHVGGYALASARTLDELTDEVSATGQVQVMELARAAQAIFPTRELTERETTALSYGKEIESHGAPVESILAGVAPDGRLIALLKAAEDTLRPIVVFAPA